MNKQIKVMLCDDSSTMRRLIKAALKKEPRLHVVYEAKDGQDAVNNLDQACPDIVVMDVEMPVMDGIVATQEIRRRQPLLPIVMFSSLTSRGAEATLDAISAGANDFAMKPTASGHINDAMEKLQADLLPKILQLVDLNANTNPSRIVKTNYNPLEVEKQSQANHRIDAIAIGVSTGGPDALAKLLMDVPKNLPVPILITQHMPPVFTDLLAKRLALRTGHNVSEAIDGEVVTNGRVIIAPGDFHLTVKRRETSVRVKLNQDPTENSCRPAVDPLFRSVAKCFGKHVIGLVLTGMGQDGARGAADIKSNGGTIIVQDEPSSVIWGMPGKVVSAGCADQILPLNEIARELARQVSRTTAPSMTTI